MSPRVVAAFVLLPLAIALERFAWYAASSVRFMRLRELGGDYEAIGSSFMMPLIGGVVAGALAAALLPRIVLVAGALCTAIGWFLASRAVDVESYKLAIDVAGLGSGAMKGCLYALAILVMPTPRLRTLYILVTYVAINVVALAAPAAGALLLEHAGYEMLFLGLAAIVTVGAMPGIAVIVVDKLAARDPVPPRQHGRAVLGALAMTACAMPLYAAITGLHQRTFDMLRDDGVNVAMVGIARAIPTLVTVLALVALVAFLASSSGARTSPTQLVGVGSFVAAFGAAAALVPSALTVVAAGIIMGVAEVASPLALSRALANHHARVVTLIAAFWLAFTWAASLIPNATVALAVSLPLLVVAGVVLVRGGARFDAWLDEEPTVLPGRESWVSGR